MGAQAVVEGVEALWADLEADWQPQNRTERLHLEQMATAPMVARADSHRREQCLPAGNVSRKAVGLAGAYFHATRQAGAFLQEYHAGPGTLTTETAGPPAAARANSQSRTSAVPPPAEPQVPHPDYVISEGKEDHPVFCSPVAPDSR